MCVRSVTSVYCRFYPHLFALYVIKIDETWRLKLRGTCQLFYDHILDKKSPNFTLSFVSQIHDYYQDKCKEILSNSYRMLLLK